jgi:predicted HD phosphohydrolase
VADLLEHLTQAKHNLDCAAKFIRDTQCRDWAITAAFYSAVHFAEAGFTATDIGHSDAKRPQDEEPHAYRERLVREKYGDICYKSYRKLRNASYNVRYLPDWRTRLGTGLDYYSQTDAEKFLTIELPQVRQEIQKAASVNLD